MERMENDMKLAGDEIQKVCSYKAKEKVFTSSNIGKRYYPQAAVRLKECKVKTQTKECR